MTQLTERLERDLREIAARAHPSSSAWDSIVGRLGDDADANVSVLSTRDAATSKRPVWITLAAAAAVVITGTVAVLVVRDRDAGSVSTANPDVTTESTTDTSPTTAIEAVPSSAPVVDVFRGDWVSTDPDGSSQTLRIVRAGADEYDVVLHDDAASASCAGAAATLTGRGVLENDERLTIARFVLTCDDGTTPAVGLPPQTDIANFAFDRDPVNDALTDSAGVVWRREGADDEPTAPASAPPPDPVPVPVPDVSSATSGGMWPQSSLDEVRAAQELADADDPASSWQLFAQSAPDAAPWGAEILSRFIEDGLGWEDYLPRRDALAYAEGWYGELVVIRCAPGRTNPLAPLYAEIPADIGDCAPTIDDFTFETVMLSLTQPQRRGPSGVWVVEEWEILQTPSEGPLFWLLYPDLGQVRQVVPPSDDEVTALLDGFLRARVDGVGAEQHLFTDGTPDTETPLLYATTGGLRYERSTIRETVQGPVWPTGWREVAVQLVAEDQTVVEQHFHVVRRDGQLGLMYGFADAYPTTENGATVALSHSEFGDTVTFTSPPASPRGDGSEVIDLPGAGTGARVVLLIEPKPEFCEDPPEIGESLQPADANAVANGILTLPGFEASEPVSVPIAGTVGLQLDLTYSGRSQCVEAWTWPIYHLDDGRESRIRVYLVDYPVPADPQQAGFRPHVLAVMVIASPVDFEAALEQAAPIVDSIQFRAGA